MQLKEIKDILNAQRYFIIKKRKWGKGTRDVSVSFMFYEMDQMINEYGEREVSKIEAFNSEYNGLKVFVK